MGTIYVYEIVTYAYGKIFRFHIEKALYVIVTYVYVANLLLYIEKAAIPSIPLSTFWKFVNSAFYTKIQKYFYNILHKFVVEFLCPNCAILTSDFIQKRKIKLCKMTNPSVRVGLKPKHSKTGKPFQI